MNNGVSLRDKTSSQGSEGPNHQTDFEYKSTQSRGKLVNRLCLVITPNGAHILIIHVSIHTGRTAAERTRS